MTTIPTLTITPDPVAPGAPFKYAGSGFDPKKKYQFALNGAGWSTNYLRPAPDGTFYDGMTAPAQEGTSKLQARIANTTPIIASVTFTVKKPVVLPPPPPPIVYDYYVDGAAGNDANDGKTPTTAWKSLGKVQASAPASSRIALSGTIPGAFMGDKPFYLTTLPGVQAFIKGSGVIGLDIQRWHGSWSIKAGEGGRITILPPGTAAEPTATNGEKAGAKLGRALSIVDSDGGDVLVYVVAGTDYGVYLKNVLHSYIWADVTDAGEAFSMHGNMGLDVDRTTVTGWAHDNHRMIRNTEFVKDDDYGSVGFSWVNTTGGKQGAGWKATQCWAPSFDYVADGGAFEWYNATDCIVEAGEGTECEGGFETGGSAGLGNHRSTAKGVRFYGNMGPGTQAAGVAAKSPVVLIRNFESCQGLEFDIDVSRARVDMEVYPDTGQFGGSLDNSVLSGRIVHRPDVIPTSFRDLPATCSVSGVSVVEP